MMGTTTDGATVAAPNVHSGPPSRLDVLDAMRGFALCGILLINLQHMGWLIDTSTPVPGTRPGTASGAVWWVQMLLVEGTMRGLFSLLFGASMILFLSKAERGTTTPAEALKLMSRRLGWLFAFGVLNATILLWPGDILIIYALAGALVLPLWRARPRTLAASAAVIVIGLSLWSAYNQLPKRAFLEEGPLLEQQAASGASFDQQQQAALEKWRDWQAKRLTPADEVERERRARLGSYSANVTYLSKVSWDWFCDMPATIQWVLDAAALMLVGMLLFRLGWLQGESPRRHCWALVVVGYGLGLPLKAVEAMADWTLYVLLGDPEFWQFILPALMRQPARLLVTLGHVGLFLLVWKAAAPFRPLQALGRMAFTGYLLQSVLAAFAFSGFGLGLWGKVDLVELFLIAAVIWTVEIAFATAWLARFSMGPFEWLWRALTYLRSPGPLARKAAVTRANS